jgi:hypothetical protein
MIDFAVPALIILIIFFIYLGSAFFIPIAELFINGLLLYALVLRTYAEIKKENKQAYYIGGAVCAMIIYLIAGNFLEKFLIWGFTTFFIMTFIFAQAGVLIKFLEDKYGKHPHHKK